ncbi:MAG: cation:proton antiporter [Thermoanaerobaculia bacterium]
MHPEHVFLLLFTLATAVALVARQLRLPYTIALVIAGLAFGTLQLVEPPHLTQEILYALILPGLLFEAAFHLRASDAWRNRLAIGTLALPGVMAGIAVTAGLLLAYSRAAGDLGGFTLAQGVVFGALIAATDPVAVVGLFRPLGAPARLRVIVEGESLLNDGTSLVLFTLAVAYAAGHPVSVGGLAVDFFRIAGAGLAAGILVGLAVSKVIQRVDDPMIEITLTTIAAYGSFVAGESVHGSGVLATVAAGMLCGNYGARTGMSPTTRVATETFWEYVAFALNSVVFLLIGFEIHVRDLLGSWKAILVAWVAVLVARALVVTAVSFGLRSTREKVPWRWSLVIEWAGLRGALSMVLVLGLSRSFPGRDLLVTMTFGVVLLTLLAQGLTMSPLLKALGLARETGWRAAYELERGRLAVAHAALARLEEIRTTREAHPRTLDALREAYASRAAQIEETMTQLYRGKEDLRTEEREAVERSLLHVEKDAAMEALRKDAIGRDAYRKLLAELDARLLELDERSSGKASR